MNAPRSLRGQLTLVFAAVAAAAILTVAIAMSVLLDHALWAPLDAALSEEADTLATVSSIGAAAELPRAVARIANEKDLGDDKFVRVFDARGVVIASAGTGPESLRDGPGRGSVRHATVHERHPYRVHWSTLADGSSCELGVRVDQHVRTLYRAHAAIAGGALALLAALAALAWTVTTRATNELERLATELETLEAASLDRRLTPPRTTEVERLATMLNRLLGRVETGMTHLRRFTADAAHELRTPIAALRARLEVALARATSAEGYRNGLLDALEQTERLARLAEDLLTLSAVEAGVAVRDERVPLDTLTREVAEFLEPVAQEQGRRFAWHAQPSVSVRGTPDLLKRVVLNLVDNAFRHTPPSAAVQLAVAAENGKACIEVQDEGPGIEADDIPHVFERFHRGTTEGDGVGLGLALCREIVVRHGGDIAVRSARGVGTTVRVTLPLAPAAAA